MTPKDHISQDLSYFSGPRTSGAITWKHNSYIYKWEDTSTTHELEWKERGEGEVRGHTVLEPLKTIILTNVIGSVTRRGQGIKCGRLFGKPKVCEFEDGVRSLWGIQEVFWLKNQEKKYKLDSNKTEQERSDGLLVRRIKAHTLTSLCAILIECRNRMASPILFMISEASGMK